MLLVGRRVEVISVERSEIKLVERVTDQVVLAAIDGRETVLHIEFQTRHEADLPERMLAYHGLLRHRHRPLLVASMLVYLMALTYFIAGRRFAHDLLTFLIRSNAMEESSTYRFVMEKGREEGRAEGREEGRAEGVRRAILDLVAARLQQVPDGLEERLASFQQDALQNLFTRLVRVQDETELRRLLPA